MRRCRRQEVQDTSPRHGSISHNNPPHQFFSEQWHWRASLTTCDASVNTWASAWFTNFKTDYCRNEEGGTPRTHSGSSERHDDSEHRRARDQAHDEFQRLRWLCDPRSPLQTRLTICNGRDGSQALFVYKSNPRRKISRLYSTTYPVVRMSKERSWA